MMKSSPELVGNSFKMGYRFQSYWGTSMAVAFFSAEVGTGLFLVSYLIDFTAGMIVGLAIAGTLKPYFHLAHMGVPSKSWRAVIRPDRSWISRGAIAIGLLIGFGVLHVLNTGLGLGQALGLPDPIGKLVGYVAVFAALVVMCYQGFAMADSESFTLWASPLVPLVSLSYSLTAGVMGALALGWNVVEPAHRNSLVTWGWVLSLVDLCLVYAIVSRARSKSKGGAFSAELLLHGAYARRFVNLVVLLGLVLPVVLLLFGGSHRLFVALALAVSLVGFFTFRLLMFKAAVFEPITHDLAGSIGLPVGR